MTGSMTGSTTGAARVVVVSAGLATPSSTGALADRLGDAVAAALAARGREAVTERVELRALAHPLADRLLTGFADDTLQADLDRVARADAVVLVTPVYAASYSGLFKMFVDVLDRGALDGTPVVVAATAGTSRHSLVLDHALRPLLAHLRATVMPTGVMAAGDDFASEGHDALGKRVERAAAELAAALAGPRASRPGPTERAEPVSFDQLLREASGDSVR